MSGDRVAVGARETGGGKGFVTVFRTDTDPWTPELPSGLRASNGANGDQFGYDVAIDGDVLVVGAPFHAANFTTDAGAAYIFTRSGSTWSEGPMLTALSVQAGARFGQSVAIAGDLVAVGAPFENRGTSQTPIIDAGVVHIFHFSGTTWTHVREFTAPTEVADDRFGFAIAMEGTTLVVGAPRRTEGSDPNNSGAAFVFDLSDSNPNNWALTDTLRDPDPDQIVNPNVGQQLGRSVAIHGDLIAAGAPFDTRLGPLCSSLGQSGDPLHIGAAHVFRRVSGTWYHEEAIRLPAPMCVFQFGWSVALTDGHLLGGAAVDSSNPNHWRGYGGYLATHTPSGWLVHRELERGDSAVDEKDLFGWAAAFLETGEPILSSLSWMDSEGAVVGRVHRFDTIGVDCNNNGIDDCIEIALCLVFDCNGNGIPDCCEIALQPLLDSNENGILDECEDQLQCGASDPEDCNENHIPDECERSGRYDLIFMIDRSESLSQNIWDRQLLAITTAICNPPGTSPPLITANGLVRVAVIVYDGDLTCESSNIRIPLTTLDSSSIGGSLGSTVTPEEFCDAVNAIIWDGSAAQTTLSGSMLCALDIFQNASNAYRRQLIILGDGIIHADNYYAATSVAETLRSLGTDFSQSGLSAGVSMLQIKDGCSAPEYMGDFQNELVNHPFWHLYRPCTPSGLWECAGETPTDGSDLYAALQRMIFQNLLRCPGTTTDVDICDENQSPHLWDCNGNGVLDCIELLMRTKLPGECETCLGDLNGDFGVDIADLLILLSEWGPCGDPGDCPADLSGNGEVDIQDLLLLLSVWGPCDPGEKVNPCTQQSSPRYEILPPQSIADCMARYGSDIENVTKCIEAMIISGTP